MVEMQLGHFHLLSKLGEGGMGEVYRAVDTRLQREVAIKLLPPEVGSDAERLARLRREAQVIAALNHPNIVTIFSIEEAGEQIFIQMELVRGKPLSALIPAHGLPVQRFFELALPLVDAIHAAHAAGVTHRDLKPANVMVSEEGRVKVLDFGLATIRRPTEQEESGDSRTDTLPLQHAVSGTVPYMSPEQIQGKPLDQRTDIFSLGIMLYEMATGQRPFQGQTNADTLAAILKDLPQPLTERNAALPRQLDRILQHCLEKDLERRFQVALDLSNELEALRRELGANEPRRASSIAVLPFDDMSPEKDQGYFCAGIAEEILSALSNIAELKVASRTSAFRFHSTGMGSREIGSRLGVATLLEGSVRKSGDRFRITVELIDVIDGYTLWSRRYDREMKDVFAVQDEIARSIVDSLKISLSPEEERAIGKTPTTDIQAYDYWLRGREFFYQYKRKGIEFALQMFSHAIELDPQYARAHAGIADCCSFLYMYGGSIEEHRARADLASRRALESDPGLAEAHVARGVALSLRGEHDASERCFETAIKLNPDLFEAHYFHARICFVQGKAERAIELYERASQVRPEDYQCHTLMAQIYDDLGRHDEAAEARREGVRLAEARLQLNPDDTRAVYMVANGLVALGEKERGLEWARRALSMDPDEPMVVYNVACIQSLAGQVEEAIDSLERAVNAGLTERNWLANDSNLDPLRKHPRFLDVMTALDRLQAARRGG